MNKNDNFDTIIVGGGIAGIVTAFQLLDSNQKILIIEKGKSGDFGGLAKESFGGITLINTPYQRKLSITDSPELALQDWERVAEFSADDKWPKKWAEYYCTHSLDIYDFLTTKKIKFMPSVFWAERGMHQTNSTLPRWHAVWGTGLEIITRLLAALNAHPNFQNLSIWFEHDVLGLETQGDRVVGVYGNELNNNHPFQVRGEHIVIASGGICGGDLSTLRANWNKKWAPAPEVILNGAHQYADGALHKKVAEIGGNLTHLDKQWLYPAGIHHPKKRKVNDGLSLVPPRSALWMNALGERIGPTPLIGNTDAAYLVQAITQQPGQYSWQVMNWKIAIKELSVSGSDYMMSFRNKNILLLLKEVLFGNKALVRRLINESEDIVTAHTLPELVEKMNTKSLPGYQVDFDTLQAGIQAYDNQIARGKKFFNDDQLRRLMNFRTYLPDRFRICHYQKILEERSFPLIAIREFILSRKSLGGIQTDLASHVLTQTGSVIPGLYAVGEAAGYGGGGVHGKGSLEGTFLGGCILTALNGARAIAGGG